MMNVYLNFVAVTLDVKDAFLMSPRPGESSSSYDVCRVRVRGQPHHSGSTCSQEHVQSYGVQQDPVQTLLFIPKKLYLTVHVDDVFMVGRADWVKEFVNYLKEKKSWNVEEMGPFMTGDKFYCLKGGFSLRMRYCDVRCDQKQYDCFEKDVDFLEVLQEDNFWIPTSQREMSHLCFQEETSASSEASRAG